jgi:hypothetical protein
MKRWQPRELVDVPPIDPSTPAAVRSSRNPLVGFRWLTREVQVSPHPELVAPVRRRRSKAASLRPLTGLIEGSDDSDQCKEVHSIATFANL